MSTELDYAALASSLENATEAGFERVSETLGVRLSKADLEKIQTQRGQTYERRITNALVFAVVRRCLMATEGIAWERFEDRGCTHVLAVRWEPKPGEARVTLAIGANYSSKRLSAVWEELEGWKPKLANNRELAIAWASKKDADRVTLVAQLRQLANLPHLELVSSLGLRQLNPGSPRRPLAALASGAKLKRIEKLVLYSCGATGDDWKALFGTLDAPRLSTIELSFNHTHPALFEALAKNSRLSGLERIREYRYTGLPGANGPAWLTAFEALAQLPLKYVAFEQASHLGDDELSAFFAKAAKARLTGLKLVGAEVTDRLLEDIERSPHASQLETLEIHNGRFSLGAVHGLLESKRLPRLQTLSLTGSYREAAWSQADLASLCATLVALPPSHSIKKIGVPNGMPEKSQAMLSKRFELLG